MGFFQFEITINVLVKSFSSIGIPTSMLWVYDHYKFVILSVRGSTLDVGILRP